MPEYLATSKNLRTFDADYGIVPAALLWALRI
jgi:hypothetical protein